MLLITINDKSYGFSLSLKVDNDATLNDITTTLLVRFPWRFILTFDGRIIFDMDDDNNDKDIIIRKLKEANSRNPDLTFSIFY